MSANPALLEALLGALAEDGSNSMIVMMIALGLEVPQIRDVYVAAFRNIVQLHPNKVIVACVSGPPEALRSLHELGILTFSTIENVFGGIAALARLHGLSSGWTLADQQVQPTDSLDLNCFRNEAAAKHALSRAGVPVLQEKVARSAEDARRIASEADGPLVMKILSPDILHKSDIGGVALDISGADEAEAAFGQITAAATKAAPHARIDGVLMAPMVKGGVELILGAKKDPVFGPIILVGLGGIYAEIFQDTSLRLAPVSTEEAENMLRELRSFPLFNGARGRPLMDLSAAAVAISSFSVFAASHAENIKEIDINPLLVKPLGQGVVALDALIVPEKP